MKKFPNYVFIVLLAALITSCSFPGEKIDQKGNLQPGDKINGFVVTKGEADAITYTWEIGECTKQADTNSEICEIALDTKLNVSWGIYEDRAHPDLEKTWLEHKYEMLINGQPVDLKAFGFIDVTHPQVGRMRHWNVVIQATQPSEITVNSKGIIGSDNFDDTTTFNFR